ncbi:MAG: hypothetical protein KTV68_19335 [Acidimicrobiia bacterium]|nr:hypothetical protein [Acidimicrobiia bacterium]
MGLSYQQNRRLNLSWEAEMIYCRRDPRYFLQNHWTIRTKVDASEQGKPELKLFELRPFQMELLHHLAEVDFLSILKGRQIGHLGWNTHKGSKPMLTETLAAGLREGWLRVRCAETLREMRTYVRTGKGSEMGGSPFDDRVMALGIAAMIFLAEGMAHRMLDGYGGDRRET